VEFNFLELVFTLALAEDIDDPYILFGIRTDFARIFRRATGCDRAGCVKCPQAADCSYHFMELDLDYKWLSRQSQEIGISSNGFRWAERDKGMSGIIGGGTFTGSMVEFHPFLLLGEYLHAEKGAAYGFGRYWLEKDG
jgi:hypothetical protein